MFRTIAHHAEPETKPDLYTALVESYLRGVQAENLSAHTQKHYRLILRAFHTYLVAQGMPTDPQSISREHIETYLTQMLTGSSPRTGKAYAASTVSAHFVALHCFFDWLIEMDELPESPMQNMKPPRVQQRPVPVLTDAQVRAVLKTCEGKGFAERRDNAIIRLLLDTGIRLSECVGLRRDDIDWDHRIIVVQGKGNKVRMTPFVSKTARALDHYLNFARRHHRLADSAFVWLGRKGRMGHNAIYNMLKRRGEEAGVPGLHAHLFRHFAAHSHLAAGGQELGLMVRMGWSSRTMISHYGASAAAERAREEHQRLNIADKF